MFMSYRRCNERNRRLRKLYKSTKNYYGHGAYYDKKKQRYVRYSVDRNGYKKYLKRYYNKKIRKSSDIDNHNGYRKLYDYWGNLL